MLKAYVGVASPLGLAVFQPERDDTRCAIERFIGDGHRVSFWAVIGDEDACSVQVLIRYGYRKEALRMLEQCVTDFGRILPPECGRPPLH